MGSNRVILAGNSYSRISGNKTDPTRNGNIWIVHTDAAGNKVKEQSAPIEFGSVGGASGVSFVQGMADGGIVLCHESTLIRLGNSGDVLWRRDLPVYVRAVEQVEGEFYVAGHTLSAPASLWAGKIDQSGALVWGRTFGPLGNSAWVTLTQNSRGDLFLGGSRPDPVSGDIMQSDFWIVAVDSLGATLWDKSFGGSQAEILATLTATPDGGFLLVGSSLSSNSGNKTSPGTGNWFVRLDSFGNKIGEEVGPRQDYPFRKLRQARDGSFLNAGGGRADPWVSSDDAWISNLREFRVPVGTPRSSVNNGFAATNKAAVADLARIEWTTSFVNGSIFYTLDGSAPGLSSQRFTSPIIVTQSTTVRAMAFSADFLSSAEADPLEITVLTAFPVTASTLGGGTVLIAPAINRFVSGTVVNITAVPDSGWTFLRWTGDTNSTDTTLNLLVDGPKSVQAVFGTSLTGTVAGPGAITFEPPGPLQPYGRVVTVTAVPAAGYYLAAWGNAATGTNNPLSITITAPNRVVSAAFTPKLGQSIQFSSLSEKFFGDPPFGLDAASSAGLPVEFSVVSGPAQISGRVLTMTGVGSIVVRASQSGNSFYNAATSVERSFESLYRASTQTVNVTTIAGSGVAGNLNAQNALGGRLNAPDGPTMAQDGTIYFADTGNNNIRYVSPAGALGTLAGGNRVGFLNAVGTNALFSFPLGVLLLRNGSLLVADTENDVFRRIDLNTARVETFSGSGARGYFNGAGASARYAFPNDLVEAHDGAIFATEFQNHIVRRIAADGTASTFAGSGFAGYMDATGTAAEFNQPAGIALGLDGNLYVTEWASHRVRKITPQGVVSTIAGTGEAGFRNGPGAAAQFRNPNGIVAGPNGDLYLCDHGNHAIRRIAPDGTVMTLAGQGTPGFADGTEAVALFNAPTGIALASDGSLIVADSQNHRIRKIAFQASPGPILQLSVKLSQSLDPEESVALQLQIRGDANRRIRIESSRNLTDWSRVRETTLDSLGHLQVIGIADDRANFYRAIPIP